MNRKAHCADCKVELIKPYSGFSNKPSVGVGYGLIGNGKRPRKVCYACCALRDEKSMQKTGKATLYLSQIEPMPVPGFPHEKPVPFKVTNWPSTLQFTVRHHRRNRHNIAGSREDVWFNDKQGATWHGTCYGSNTQILHCKRLQTY